MRPAPSPKATDADHPLTDVVVELPVWLEERLALGSPNAVGSFDMPAATDDGVAVVWPRHVGDFPLWPENQVVWDLFTACATQWQHAGMEGMKTGLNYAGVEVVASRTGVKLSHARFADLQLLENAALVAWNDQARADAELKK